MATAKRTPPNRSLEPLDRLDLDELKAAVTHHFGISAAELSAPRSRQPTRAVLAYLARRHGSITLRALAAVLGLCRADCVPYLLDRARQAKPDSCRTHASSHSRADGHCHPP